MSLDTKSEPKRETNSLVDVLYFPLDQVEDAARWKKEFHREERQEKYKQAHAVLALVGNESKTISPNSFDSQGNFNILMYLILNGFTHFAIDFLRNPKVELTLTDKTYGATALHWAAYMGNGLVVRRLLALIEGDLAFINATDKHGDTALMNAVRANSLEIVRLLCEAGADSQIERPNTVAASGNPRTETALDIAIKAKNDPIVEYLKTHQTPKSKDSKENPSASSEAIHIMGQELISAIKERKNRFFAPLQKAREIKNAVSSESVVDEKQKPKVEISPEKAEAEKEKVKAAQATLQQFEEAAKYVNCNGRTPWDYAVEEANLYAMLQLIELGVDVNRKNQHGVTALQSEAEEGNISAIRALSSPKIRSKLNLEVQDMEGNTPLANAAKAGHFDIARALLALGANRNTQNAAGEDLGKHLNDFLTLKANPEQSEEWLEFQVQLYDAKTDFQKIENQRRSIELINLFDKTTMTSPYGDERLQRIQKAQELVELGISVESVKGRYGYSALEHFHEILLLAVRSEYVPLVYQIARAFPNLITRDALLQAVYNGNHEVVRALLVVLKEKRSEQFVSIINAGKHQETPLDVTVSQGHIHTAKLLIAAGAEYKKTARDLAKRFLPELIPWMNEFEQGEAQGALPDAKSFNLTDKQRSLALDPFSDDMFVLPDQKASEALVQQLRERRSLMLINALKNGEQEEVGRLMKLGREAFDVDYCEPSGLNIFHHAAMVGDDRIIGQFATRDNKGINAKGTGEGTKGGGAPLHLACRYMRPSAVKALLDAGADFTALGRENGSPLALAEKIKDGHVTQIKGNVGLTPTQTLEAERLSKIIALLRAEPKARAKREVKAKAKAASDNAAAVSLGNFIAGNTAQSADKRAVVTSAASPVK